MFICGGSGVCFIHQLSVGAVWVAPGFLQGLVQLSVISFMAGLLPFGFPSVLHCCSNCVFDRISILQKNLYDVLEVSDEEC